MDVKKQEKFTASINKQIANLETQLAENLDAHTPIEPDVAIGRLSRVDALQDQQMRLALERNRKDELARLENARRLIATGKYGTCNNCEEDIPLARLEAVPDAQMCVPCLTELQKQN